MRESAQIAANEIVRAILRTGVRLAGAAMTLELRRRVARYAGDQRRLAARYGVGPDTPIAPYGEAVRQAVEAFAAGHADARFAYTSGSTAEPKKIAFTNKRLRAIKLGSFSVAARLIRRHPVDRMGLFILSGLKEDDSLTALLLSDRGRRTPWAAGLLMPARYLAQPEMAPIVAGYGATAARLWLLVLANPGIVYSTNPSTLAVFLTDVREAWPAATALIRDQVRDPGALDPLRDIVARVAAPGWRDRFARIAAAGAPLSMRETVPGWRVYCCWDGGYVRPFLDRIREQLPDADYTFVPMYSMLTETVETLNYFDGDQVRFLPVAPDVLYEFVPEGAADLPANLVPAWALEVGRVYAMVVSDPYGLRRYQTEDLFRCAGKVGDAPDLRFLRRRGLAYSFTGEKLTDSHTSAAFERLRGEFPALRAAGVQMTCIPSQPAGAVVPRYRLVLACPGRAPELDLDAVGAAFDRALSEVNRELAAKLESGRLGASRAALLSYDALAAALDGKTRDAGDAAARGWDTQFKLLPLYRRRWEEYDGLPD